MIDRKKAPQLTEISQLSLLTPATITLSNGVKIYSIREVSDATIRVDFEFNASSSSTHTMVANLVGELLLAGTDRKSSDEIDEQIDALGGYTDVKVSTERTSVTIFGLLENIIPILRIVIDALLHATFPEKEIKQTLSENKKRLEIQLQKGKTIAQRKFIQHLLGNTPYGRLIELADFKECSRESLLDFHQNTFLKSLSHINIVGAISDEQLAVVKELGACFTKEIVQDYHYDFKYHPQTFHIEKKGALQTAIRIGKMLFNKKHPDYKKFIVVNTILGGYFGSRLMTSIREDKGYTYGIGSGVSQLLETGYFFIASEVAKEYKDLTLAAIKHEIEILQTTLVEEEELSLVKSYLVGQILEASDGAQNMMNNFHSVNNFGLTLDYYNALIQTIHEITAEEIRFYSEKYLKWEDMTIVTVG